MAYTAGDYAITVVGNLPGGEVFANRWCVSRTDPGADPQDAVAALRDFYLVWSNACNEDWEATGADVRDLAAEVSFGGTWATVPGQEDTNNPLPDEVAVRISFKAGAANGGPYMCGLSVAHVDPTGNLAAGSRTAFAAGLSNLIDDLVAADFVLALDTKGSLETVTQIRLGQVFDVIRRRRNKLSESYTVINP